MDNKNPFAGLVEETNSEKKPQKTEKQLATNVLEDVFGFTLIEENAIQRNLIFLRDLSDVFPKRELDTEILEHALFERLLVDDENRVDVLVYLFDCYCNSEMLEGEIHKSVKAIVMRNIVTSLTQPDLYTDQNVNQQFFNLVKMEFCSKPEFFDDLYTAFIDYEGE